MWVNTTHLCSFPDGSSDGSGGAAVGFGTSSSRGRFQGSILCDTAPAVLQGHCHGWEGGEERAQTGSTPGYCCSVPGQSLP